MIYKIIELLLLFVLTPIILATNIPIFYKVTPAIIGAIYCFTLLIKQKQLSGKALFILNGKMHWKPIVIRFLITMLISTILMYFFNEENLFIVVRKNVLIWIGISLVYSIFSVYPQELIYRVFFFHRYKVIFNNEKLLVTVNAVLFSIAHIAFKNWLVLALTLIGGFLFAITYKKSNSIMLTSIEHMLYGTWLFTLGMGEMLAFPVPE